MPEKKECRTKECAHFIGKDQLRFYRGRFLWTVVVATIAVAVLFFLIEHRYSKAIEDVVEVHKGFCDDISSILQPVELAKDSCVYANEQLVLSMKEHMKSSEALLQLQSQKIQSDFTLLSIWAGLLMIVFLVFSIYSMFKTDELIKQGREGLRKIEEADMKVGEHMSNIDKKVEEETKRVQEEATKKIGDITNEACSALNTVKEQAEAVKNSFSNTVKEKTEAFLSKYGEAVKKMEELTAATKLLYQMYDSKAKQSRQEEKDEEVEEEQCVEVKSAKETGK